MARPSRQSHAVELILFPWHMPEDTTECVANSPCTCFIEIIRHFVLEHSHDPIYVYIQI